MRVLSERSADSRFDFGARICTTRCSNASCPTPRKLTCNRGCEVCGVVLCRPCFAGHVHAKHSWGTPACSTGSGSSCLASGVEAQKQHVWALYEQYRGNETQNKRIGKAVTFESNDSLRPAWSMSSTYQDELAERIARKMADTMPWIFGEAEASMLAFGTTFHKYILEHEDKFKRLRNMEKPDGWRYESWDSFSADKAEVQIYTKSLRRRRRDPLLSCFKGVMDINASVETILQHLLNFEARVSYDELMISGKMVENQLPYYRTMYGRFSAGVPMVADRDFVLRAIPFFEEDGSVLIHIQSELGNERAEGVPAPNETRAVRGSFVDGGYIVRVLESGGCRVTYTGSVNPNGWIPKGIAKMFMWKQALVLQQFNTWLLTQK